LDDALKAFEAAKVEMPKDGLINCGKRALQFGWFETARRAFDAAVGIELRSE
jgi:hypothetical protein